MVMKKKHQKISGREIYSKIEREKVINWPNICDGYNASSKTLKGRLKPYNTKKSINHHGQYITSTAHFNTNKDVTGFWTYNNIVFSEHGDLTESLVFLVNESENGLTSKELEEIVKTPPNSSLMRLFKAKKIFRMKMGYEYLYLSTDSVRQREQIENFCEKNKETQLTTEGLFSKDKSEQIKKKR